MVSQWLGAREAISGIKQAITPQPRRKALLTLLKPVLGVVCRQCFPRTADRHARVRR